jgi:hypothetical protein
VPLGVWLLVNLPPAVMRFAISAVILAFVAMLGRPR